MTVKFKLNQPLWVRFPYGRDHREVEGIYGVQYLYHVQVDGRPERLYAHPRLHRALRALDLRHGGEVCITQVRAEGNRREWLVQADPQAPRPLPATAQPHCPAPPANGHAHPGAPSPPPTSDAASPTHPTAPDIPPADRLEAWADLMHRCLVSSSLLWANVGTPRYTSADVCAVGIALFRECRRQGLAPEALGLAVPF